MYKGKRLFDFCFVLILLFPLANILRFFFTTPIFETWDMGGHYLASTYLSHHLWPWPTGWNFMNFNGYPQGYFYPPLTHWLIGTLGKILPLQRAFQFSIAFIFISYIGIIWLICTQHFKIWNQQVTLFIWCLIAYWMTKGAAGGDINGLFYGGLVSNSFAILFLLLSIFDLFNLLTHPSKSYELRLALWFGLSIWTHPFISIAILFLYVGAFIYTSHKKKYFRSFVKIISISAALSIAWWLPYLVLRKFQSGTFVNITSREIALTFLLNGFVVSGAVVFAMIYAIAQRNKFKQVSVTFFRSMSLTFMGLLILVGFFHWQLKFLSNFQLPFHGYRLYSVLYILLCLSVGTTLAYTRWATTKWGLILQLVLVTLVSLYGLHDTYGTPIARSHIVRPQIKEVATHLGTDSILTISPIEGTHTLFDPHWLPFNLNENGHSTSHGLFTESSLKGKFYSGVAKLHNFSHFTWGSEAAYSNTSNLKKYFKYLGIAQIITPEVSNKYFVQQGDLYLTKKIQLQNNITPPSLEIWGTQQQGIHSLTQAPLTACHDFNEKLPRWWANAADIDHLLIEACESNFPYSSKEKTGTLLRKSWDTYEFTPASNEYLTWYLPMSYFPHWHIKSANEKQKLYQAGPHNLAILTDTPLTLEFRRPLYEKLAYLLSLSCLFWVLGSLVRNLVPKRGQ